MDNNEVNPYSIEQDSEVQRNDVPQYTYVEGWMGSATQVNPQYACTRSEYQQEAPGQDITWQNAMGQNPYAQNAAQQNPYAQNAAQQNPYAQNAAQQNPYAQNTAQQNPYAQNTAQQNPYASDAYWSTPYRQVPYYQQPVGSTYMQSAANRVSGNGMVGFAITSLVCGICSILACCVPVFDLVFVVIGLILGIIAIAKKYNGQGMAAAGVICSTIGLGLNIICIVLIAIE